MEEQVRKTFAERFGAEGEIRMGFAPGRVNLIGEHTDYNGGHVFPCALTMGIWGAARRREDRILRLYSLNFPEAGVVETSLDDLVYRKEAGWTNYLKGVLWAFGEKGFPIPAGLDMAVGGNIPEGAGLSSSAALEVLTGVLLRDLFDLPADPVKIARMGQFAGAMGKKDCAIFLDTADLSYEYVPVSLADARIVIANSNVRHSLAGSEYNVRRQQCEAALAQLQQVIGIETLGDLNGEQFEVYQAAIPDPAERKRAKHAVYENQRTREAVTALKENDLESFGRLMNASHVSLRDDYEVSCPELDVLAEEAWKIPGVFGSRMTGGGFGGCTVSIVRTECVETFLRQVGAAYKERTGKTADFYVAEIGPGAGVRD